MSDTAHLLRDVAERLFAEGCTARIRVQAETGEWPAALWHRIEEAQLAMLAVPEALGGAGLSLAEAMVLAHAVGRHAAPVPLIETVLGHWLFALTGQRPVAGPVSVTSQAQTPLHLTRSASNRWCLSGVARCVPWGGQVAHVVVVAESEEAGDVVLAIESGALAVQPGRSVAFEPRATLRFEDVAIADDAVQAGRKSSAGSALLLAGGLARSHQMVGAMDWTLEQTLVHARERSQFGKPIAGFQSVQHMLAIMAGQVCAATASADAALAAVDTDDFEDAVAIAKARVGEAAAEVAAIAHQVHGAMGYCQEFALHYRTKRLWSWRDEFGTERDWQIRLGQHVAARGADAFWQRLAEMN
ncbi:MAG TPA: acyl-CoA dehydrogenase family protein [Ramlibacter sp.]|uniref:acyl-CoA dehydrogenase family protein n=1 Tax=Ramlibacter sp. TaxID=1917967 RepID=UPI002C0052BB|nr:acyl-CoA dehydrogenase family protein [Ramlibacter sp.]HVZ42642.1 acyl-CoA dehydrogenase family protein [Ramlibacter sp.]